MARFLRLSVACSIVSIVALAACGGAVAPDGTASTDPSSTGGPAGSSAPGDDDPPTTVAASCGTAATSTAICPSTPITIESEKDLAMLVSRLAWPLESDFHPVQLLPSADLFFPTTIDIGAAALPAGGPCGRGVPVPCHSTVFAHEDAIPGVHCLATEDSSFGRKICTRIRVDAGTTFRVFMRTEDHHPSFPIYWPIVELAPSCATPCGPNELRCADSQLCLPEGGAFCLNCQALDAAVCACRDDRVATCGAIADGGSCGYSVAGDLLIEGTCSAGKCTSARH